MANVDNNIRILQDSLQKARKYYEEKNYGRSFAHYLVVFQLLQPEARNVYEKEFTDILYLWGSILHSRKQYEDVFKCYHLATLYFPTSVEILNNLGIHALKLQNFNAAKSYFEKSISFDSNFLPAEQNLQTTKYTLVERWHFPMLNDIKRNKSYGQAIFMEIANGFANILDVGTGTGILSLFASKSKQCKSIIACDYSEVMFEMATKVVTANNAQNIQLIKKSSTDLIIPNDLKQKASLLVTEILDSGVFGENILETVIHAWENLLLPSPVGKVIPAGVDIYVTGIRSDELTKKVHLKRRTNNLLNINNLRLVYLPLPYDTENLKFEKVNYMTNTELGLHIDFNNLQQLKSLKTNYSRNVKLKCNRNGKIEAFAVWFTLHLNNSVSLTNHPNSPLNSCWEQAIFYLPYPISVKNNEEFFINMSYYKGYLDINCLKNGYKQNSLLLSYEATIPFLNDTLLLNHIQNVSSRIIEHFKNTNINNISVLDLSPFPILGLLLAKHGAKLTYRVPDKTIETAIRRHCELNSINVNTNIHFVTIENFNDFIDKNVYFDVIFQNYFNPCGLLNEFEVFQAQLLRYNLTNQGMYIPENVYVYAQLVQCDWLEQATKVNDSNVCGFKIAEFINEYKSTEQRNMNFQTVPHINLSEPVKIGLLNTNNISEATYSKISSNIIKTGQANAIFYWFDIELLKDETLSTRRNEAFINNTAFMLDNPLIVNTGDKITLILKQHRGILKIYYE